MITDIAEAELRRWIGASDGCAWPRRGGPCDKAERHAYHCQIGEPPHEVHLPNADHHPFSPESMLDALKRKFGQPCERKFVSLVYSGRYREQIYATHDFQSERVGEHPHCARCHVPAGSSEARWQNGFCIVRIEEPCDGDEPDIVHKLYSQRLTDEGRDKAAEDLTEAFVNFIVSLGQPRGLDVTVTDENLQLREQYKQQVAAIIDKYRGT